MSSLAINPTLAMTGPATPSLDRTPRDPKKIADAAQDFEAMLIEQMLKSSRESGTGDWMGCSEDPTGSTACELAEQQFAKVISSHGGFGVAKLVLAGLDKK